MIWGFSIALQYFFFLTLLFFFLTLLPSGCQTEMVQLAVIPALSAAVAGGTQESERAFWFWGPLILPVSENPALLQPLPVCGDGGVLGDTSGCPSPAALC